MANVTYLLLIPHHTCSNDENCIEQLSEAAKATGFYGEFIAASLVDCEIDNMDVAFLNPPFSLTLDSPSMVPMPCCTFGKYGKNKRANSTFYAVEQALLGSSIVVALLPNSTEEYFISQNSNPKCFYERQLAAIVRLPKDAFKAEGISINASLFIFDSKSRKEPFTIHNDIEAVVDLDLRILERRAPKITPHGTSYSEPEIITPVTGDNTVRIAHSSRWVSLKFACGRAEALVKNTVLIDRIRPTESKIRAAKKVKYVGQGLLDIEAWLAAGTAQEGLELLCSRIREAGGEPVIDAGLQNFVAKRDRQSIIDNSPFRKWVYRASGAKATGPFIAICHTSYMLDEESWLSPVIDEGKELKITPTGNSFEFNFEGTSYSITEEILHAHFELKDKESKGGEWVCLFEGRVHDFPERAQELKTRAQKQNIFDFLSWDYQSHDLIR